MDEMGFEDKGNIIVPEKGDVRTEKMVSDVKKGITKDQIKDELKQESGAVEPKKGSLTKDVPQLMFKVVAKTINCPKFELDDSEAQTMATHLNILLPIEGKVASVVVILMITINKVYTCMDAITAKLRPASIEEKPPQQPPMNEPLS